MIALILWLVSVFGSSQVIAQRGPTPVEVVPVVAGSLQEEVSFIATFEADVSTTVGAVVAGRVIEAKVREGDRVVLGKTVLLQLDDLEGNCPQGSRGIGRQGPTKVGQAQTRLSVGGGCPAAGRGRGGEGVPRSIRAGLQEGGASLSR